MSEGMRRNCAFRLRLPAACAVADIGRVSVSSFSEGGVKYGRARAGKVIALIDSGNHL